MTLNVLLYLLAAICFLLRALGVAAGRIDLMNLGFFFLVLTLLF